MTKAWAWIKTKWKALLGFLALTITAALYYSRTKDQKKILDYTDKSLRKEIDTHKEHEKKIIDGLEEIQKSKDKKLEEASKDHKKNSKALEEKKKEFIKDSEEDKDLAKKLADKIGVDFVE